MHLKIISKIDLIPINIFDNFPRFEHIIISRNFAAVDAENDSEVLLLGGLNLLLTQVHQLMNGSYA